MRRVLILLCALAATAAAAQTPAREAPMPASRDDAAIQAWLKAYIDARDYAFIDITADQAYFLQPPSGGFDLKSPLVRVTRRHEYFTPQTSRQGFRYRSAINLVELDCANTRLRILTTQAYAFSNLQGERRSVDEQAPQWRYPREGVIAETELAMICALRQDDIDAQPKPPPARELLK